MQQWIVATSSGKDLSILIAELNVKFGIDNTGYEDNMEQHELGERNKDSGIFVNHCPFNMVKDGIIFPHTRIHKAIQVSLDHKTENQIDYTGISKMFIRSMEDFRQIINDKATRSNSIQR